MISLKRLAGIFLGVFAVALGIQYAPDGVKTALGIASLVVIIAWFFGYIDIKEILNERNEEKK